jgi:hypothetical protein
MFILVTPPDARQQAISIQLSALSHFVTLRRGVLSQ